jgi:hypothetical protein
MFYFHLPDFLGEELIKKKNKYKNKYNNNK